VDWQLKTFWSDFKLYYDVDGCCVQERLALLYEQETLRVQCHSARAHADASHSAVLSVCSLLRIDEGLYGGGTTSQGGNWGGCASAFVDNSGVNHEDRDQRARFGTRHFFAWMQDVQEKFYRLKVGWLLACSLVVLKRLKLVGRLSVCWSTHCCLFLLVAFFIGCQ